MKNILTLATILVMSAAPAFATEPSKVSAQGEKMKACAQEYHSRNLSKSEYKTFIKACLKKDYKVGSYQAHQSAAVAAPVAMKSQAPTAPDTATPAKLEPKEQMKKCNADAKVKNLKGDDRKKFMRSCLAA